LTFSTILLWRSLTSASLLSYCLSSSCICFNPSWCVLELIVGKLISFYSLLTLDLLQKSYLILIYSCLYLKALRSFFFRFYSLIIWITLFSFSFSWLFFFSSRIFLSWPLTLWRSTNSSYFGLVTNESYFDTFDEARMVWLTFSTFWMSFL